MNGVPWRGRARLTLPSSTSGTSIGHATPSPVESPLRSPFPSVTRLFKTEDNTSESLPDTDSTLCQDRSEPPKQIAKDKGTNESQEESAVTNAAETKSTYNLTEIPITFAVDVSGSTEGAILQREQFAMSKICDLLNPRTLSAESKILPWSHRAKAPVHATDMKRLVSGGGTDPSVLLDDSTSCSTLQSSNLWFLLTDGAIDEPNIHKFANAIPKAGIHGTACVIILFGYASDSPYDCNITVGLSVFAVAPHSIFLFHDVKSDLLFVLQGKGCFLDLLPEEKKFISFGGWTRWKDLVQIKYEDLAKLRVPASAKLSQDSVLLPDGREFDMRHIYNNTLSDADKQDILADYKALDVILGAARSRGREDDVRSWAQSSRGKGKVKDVLEAERIDIGNQAVNALKSFISELVSENKTTNFKDEPELLWRFIRVPSRSTQGARISQDLRNSHAKNWAAVKSKIQYDSHLSSQMDQALDEVLDTIEEYHTVPKPYTTLGLNDRTKSPGAMSMMSSPSPSIAARSGYRSNALRAERRSPVQFRRGSDKDTINIATPVMETYDIIFPVGFKGTRFLEAKSGDRLHSSVQETYDTCPLCGEESVIQTLLLRRCVSNEETSHLPLPNRRAGHRYPMVLGDYPETDVIAPLVTCDACAFGFLRAGKLPNGEQVHSILPLVALTEEKNRRQWLRILEDIYMHRFHSNIVFLVFLSTLCSTIEDLEDTDEPSSSSLIRALEWCCREICTIVPGLSTKTGLTPEGSPLRDMIDQSPYKLDWMLKIAFTESEEKTTLLSYPLSGCVGLVRLAALSDVGAPNIERFVWKRLLYHFVESHASLEPDIGAQKARLIVKGKTDTESQASSAEDFEEQENKPQRRSSISLMSLTDSHFLCASQGVMETFRRMGDHFSAIETTSKFDPSMAVFLNLLEHTLEGRNNGVVDPGTFFTILRRKADEVRRKSEAFQDIFEDPRLVTEAMAAEMIGEILKLEDSGRISLPVP